MPASSGAISEAVLIGASQLPIARTQTWLDDDVDYYRLHLSHSRGARVNRHQQWPWHASCIRSDEQAAGELTAMRQVNGGCDGESDRILRSGLFPENS